MKKIILSNRTESPAFFDMSGQHRPPDCYWSYGYGFRIGDRAAAYIRCLEWRKENPYRKLIILDDPLRQGTGLSRSLPSEWLFKNVADEIWSTEESEERVPLPEGSALYDKPLWAYWAEDKDVKPNLRTETQVDISQFNIPSSYVTIQPLTDASYNIYRNAPAEWWWALISSLNIPVVVLGDYKLGGQMPCPRNAFPVYSYALSAMESLSIIQRARWHIGGETGTTIWSPILGVPTIGLYSQISTWPNWDTKPKSFGKPVSILPLGDRADNTAVKIISEIQRS